MHLNPAGAKVLKPDQPLSAFGWSTCARAGEQNADGPGN